MGGHTLQILTTLYGPIKKNQYTRYVLVGLSWTRARGCCMDKSFKLFGFQVYTEMLRNSQTTEGMGCSCAWRMEMQSQSTMYT